MLQNIAGESLLTGYRWVSTKYGVGTKTFVQNGDVLGFFGCLKSLCEIVYVSGVAVRLLAKVAGIGTVAIGNGVTEKYYCGTFRANNGTVCKEVPCCCFTRTNKGFSGCLSPFI